MRRLLIVTAAAAALSGAPTAGAAGCGTAVLEDWADGKVDSAYPVRCYQDAPASMPDDMRSYTTAPDDIRRALLARIRLSRTHHAKPGARPRALASAPRAPAREALSAASVAAGGTGIPLPLI